MSIILLKGGVNGGGSDDCTALSENVLVDYTAVTNDSDDEPIVGTMPMVGGQNELLDANGRITIQKGYHDGNGIISQMVPTAGGRYTPGKDDIVIPRGTYVSSNIVLAGDANLISSNIRNGYTVFGVTGSYKDTVAIPTISGSPYYFTYGSTVTPTISGYDSSLMNRSGTTSTTSGGNYSTTYSLKDTNRYCWIDGSTGTKTLNWTTILSLNGHGKIGWSTWVVRSYKATGGYDEGYEGTWTYNASSGSGSGGATAGNWSFDSDKLYLYASHFKANNSDNDGTNQFGSLSTSLNFDFTIAAGKTIHIDGSYGGTRNASGYLRIRCGGVELYRSGNNGVNTSFSEDLKLTTNATSMDIYIESGWANITNIYIKN